MKRNYRILGTKWRLFKDSIYYRIHAWFCFMGKNWNMLSLQKFSLRILFCLDIFGWMRNDLAWRHTHSKKMNQEYFPATATWAYQYTLSKYLWRHKMMSIFFFAINCKHNLWRQRAQTTLKAIRRWFVYTDITKVGGYITITSFFSCKNKLYFLFSSWVFWWR